MVIRPVHRQIYPINPKTSLVVMVQIMVDMEATRTIIMDSSIQVMISMLIISKQRILEEMFHIRMIRHLVTVMNISNIFIN